MSVEATGNPQQATVPPADAPPPAAAAPEAPADTAEPGPAEPAPDAWSPGASAIAEGDRAEPGEPPEAAQPGEPVRAGGPGEPPEAAEPGEPAGPAEPGELPEAAEPGEPAGAAEPASPAAGAAGAAEPADRAEQDEWAAEQAEWADQAELPEAAEPVELVGAAEPVEWEDPPHRRRGFALAAAFVVAALVIVGGAIGTVGALTHGFHKPAKLRYQESAVFKLQTGDCVNAPNAQVVSVLPCSTPHQAEVFATFSLPTSAWPGTPTVRTEASSGCASRLTGYLNPQLAISLKQSYVFPDQVAWTAGTRTVICEVQATSGQLTGSVRAAS